MAKQEKKYMALDEVAEFLGMETEQVNRIREKGDLRGFADRGTWKFKVVDVEEFSRTLQADSDPSVPLLPPEAGSTVFEDDDAADDQPTEIRKSDSKILESPSDSDVRLILDDELTSDEMSDPEISKYSDEKSSPGTGLEESDSDVQLIGDSGTLADHESTDSDVKLITESDSDSDVQLVPAQADSDSDVKLVSSLDDTDSDVGSDSDVRLISRTDTDPDLNLQEDKESVLAEEGNVSLSGEAETGSGLDSGIALESLADSGVSLESVDSGIALEGGESGISLEGADSGIAMEGLESDSELESSDIVIDDAGSDSDVSLVGAEGHIPPDDVDSGISLENMDSDIGLEEDSGLALSGLESDLLLDDDSGLSISEDSDLSLAEDSGIGLENFADSGIALDEDSEVYSLTTEDSGIAIENLTDDDDDVMATIPMMESSDLLANELDETQMEVPMLDDDDEFELSLADDGESSGSVILFDDEDEADEHDPTMIRSSVEDTSDGFTDEFEVMEGESLDIDDGDESEYEMDAFDDDDMEFEDDLDVFDADDEDFSDSFETGESQAAFVAPAAGQQRIASPAAETDWGAPTFIGLLLSSSMMTLCAILMFDLVRSMWNWEEPASMNGSLLETIGNLFS